MLELTKRGFHVIGVDFADNCRDEAAKDLAVSGMGFVAAVSAACALWLLLRRDGTYPT
jgi:hypothetical protein